jgi:uncharacterized OB-fold protein
VSPGRVDQIIGELRALTTDKDRPQDEVTTVAVAIRLLESQQREIADLKSEVRDVQRGAAEEATWRERQGDEYGSY